MFSKFCEPPREVYVNRTRKPVVNELYPILRVDALGRWTPSTITWSLIRYFGRDRLDLSNDLPCPEPHHGCGTFHLPSIFSQVVEDVVQLSVPFHPDISRVAALGRENQITSRTVVHHLRAIGEDVFGLL